MNEKISAFLEFTLQGMRSTINQIYIFDEAGKGDGSVRGSVAILEIVARKGLVEKET